MDYSLYRTINGLSGWNVADDVFSALADDLTVVIVAIVALAFLVPWRHRDSRRCGAVVATVAAALALLADQPIASAVDRVRPYVAHPEHANLLIARSHDPSFPSDHAAGAFAIAIAFLFYDRVIGTVLLVLGAVLAFARVYVGIHYPGDIVGGALVGAAAALVLRWSPVRSRLERFALACSGLLERFTPARLER